MSQLRTTTTPHPSMINECIVLGAGLYHCISTWWWGLHLGLVLLKVSHESVLKWKHWSNYMHTLIDGVKLDLFFMESFPWYSCSWNWSFWVGHSNLYSVTAHQSASNGMWKYMYDEPRKLEKYWHVVLRTNACRREETLHKVSGCMNMYVIDCNCMCIYIQIQIFIYTHCVFLFFN